MATQRHPVTGRFMAMDCEIDCLEHCAGLCGCFSVDSWEPIGDYLELRDRLTEDPMLEWIRVLLEDFGIPFG